MVLLIIGNYYHETWVSKRSKCELVPFLLSLSYFAMYLCYVRIYEYEWKPNEKCPNYTIYVENLCPMFDQEQEMEVIPFYSSPGITFLLMISVSLLVLVSLVRDTCVHFETISLKLQDIESLIGVPIERKESKFILLIHNWIKIKQTYKMVVRYTILQLNLIDDENIIDIIISYSVENNQKHNQRSEKRFCNEIIFMILVTSFF